MIDVSLKPEYISRGRNLLAMVTTRGKHKDNERILKSAARHESHSYKCSANRIEEVCPFVGDQLIEDKVRLGSSEEHEEWDSREELRAKLLHTVEAVLGGV